MGIAKCIMILQMLLTFISLNCKSLADEQYHEVYFTITAYSYTGSITASGTETHRGVVAADPDVLSFGTKLYIPGYGEGVVEDTGGDIQGNRLDIFFDTEEECFEWGCREVVVKVYN